MTRSLRLAFGLSLFGITLALATPGLRFFSFAVTPLGTQPPIEAVFELAKGTSPNEITRWLLDHKIIEDGRSMLWLGKLSRQWGKIKAGEYRVSTAQSPREILATLTSGVSMAHAVTIKEGDNMYEVAAAMGATGLVTEAQALRLFKNARWIETLGFEKPSPRTLEGYLAPETYFFNRTQTPEDMVRMMVKRAQSYWTPEKLEKLKATGLTRTELVTLASVVEKETGAGTERAKIASVFYNRLRKHMKLQSDPTIIYGIWERYDGNIHKADILSQTPFNTYVVKALPAGPISNPGRLALDATLAPETTEYLYFVSHNDGTHEFTSTYTAHLEAVKRFQLNAKAREGRSWRELKQ